MGKDVPSHTGRNIQLIRSSTHIARLTALPLCLRLFSKAKGGLRNTRLSQSDLATPLPEALEGKSGLKTQLSLRATLPPRCLRLSKAKGGIYIALSTSWHVCRSTPCVRHFYDIMLFYLIHCLNRDLSDLGIYRIKHNNFTSRYLEL
jgi:hypothetical protein